MNTSPVTVTPTADVKMNVLLTCVELTGLLIIICIGLWAIGPARATCRA